jgi:hypothetical protein
VHKTPADPSAPAARPQQPMPMQIRPQVQTLLYIQGGLGSIRAIRVIRG